MCKCKCINKECRIYNEEHVFKADTTYREFNEEYGEFVLSNKCSVCFKKSIILITDVNLNKLNFINKGASKQVDNPKQSLY